MKRLIIFITILLFACNLGANDDLLIYKVDNKDKKFSAKSVEEGLKKSGITVLVNRDMNGPFIKQFKKSSFEIYHLITAYDKNISVKLVSHEPLSGIFVPFSMGVWQKKGDSNFYVSVLSSDGMSKIVGSNKDLYKKLESKIQSAIKRALPNSTLVKPKYSPIPTDKKLISKFVSEVADDEADDNKDELEMVFESGLKPIGFIKAGQLSFDFDLDEAKNNDFAFYDTFSMCKLKVIYNIAQTRPEAGAFAPCTLAIYHKNKTNKTTIAFPNVYNWISTLSIKDKKLVEILTKAQSDIEKLIKSTLE